MRSTILKASVALSMAVLCLSRKSPRIVLVAATLFAVVCLVYVSELRIRKLAASYVLGPERISEQSSPGMFSSVSVRVHRNSQQPQPQLPASSLACLLTTRTHQQKAIIAQTSTACHISRIYVTVIALTVSQTLQGHPWIASTWL